MERRKVLNVLLIVLIAAWLIAEALTYVFIVTKTDSRFPFSVTYLSIVADLAVTLGILIVAILKKAGGSITGARLLECVFLFLAYVCTAIADYFLTITADRYEIAVGVFIGAQLFHFLRISAARGAVSREAGVRHPLLGIFLSITARAVLTVLLILVLHLAGLWSLLNLLAVIYFVELLLNTVDAAFTAEHGFRFAVMAAGFLLFICCDVTVGLRALAEDGTLSMTPDRFALNTYLTWVFYLPSQVLIILSVLARKKAPAAQA